MIEQISVKDLKQKLDEKQDIQLVDVREFFEYDISNLGGIHIPLRNLQTDMKRLDASKETVVMCRSGARSYEACRRLKLDGFNKVFNLEGGMLAWAHEIDPSIPVA